MRAQGKSPDEIKLFVADAFAKGTFPPPILTNADLGSKGKGGGRPAFVVGEGTPHARIIVSVSEQGMSHTPNGQEELEFQR